MSHETAASVWVRDSAPDDPRDLRRALGTFATGVTVVTTVGEGGQPIGLTVNSFSSVSLEPPLVLWSLVLKSPQLEVFRAARHFAVNILSDAQEALCRQFAAPVPDRFAGVAWRPGVGGVPVIEGAVAQFECVTETSHPGGDHEIFIGRVARYRWSQRAPLLFCNGALSALPAAAAAA
ncbi:MAG TPA: flavin reductase family protein [Azospirillum sp.]|nr:flavin reductase family protein [Azospirillum sp.]